MKSLLSIYTENGIAFEESGFEAGGDYWSAPYLYKHVDKQKLKVEKIYLKHLDLSRLPWSNGSITSIDSYLYHSVRVQNADYSIPIVLCWDGYIMDGWHRVINAMLHDELWIFGYRFESYLKPEKKGKKK